MRHIGNERVQNINSNGTDVIFKPLYNIKTNNFYQGRIVGNIYLRISSIEHLDVLFCFLLKITFTGLILIPYSSFFFQTRRNKLQNNLLRKSWLFSHNLSLCLSRQKWSILSTVTNHKARKSISIYDRLMYTKRHLLANSLFTFIKISSKKIF